MEQLPYNEGAHVSVQPAASAALCGEGVEVLPGSAEGTRRVPASVCPGRRGAHHRVAISLAPWFLTRVHIQNP